MNTPMATRAAAHRCSALRSLHHPPFSAAAALRRPPRLPPPLRPRFAHSLVDAVLEELHAMRAERRMRAEKRVRAAAAKMGFPSAKELEVKIERRDLQKGSLLEFRKDPQKLLLGVAQKPDGKKNWMVYDQVLLETTTAAC